jgi:ABC-type lipoprotein export system ATPase subunit
MEVDNDTTHETTLKQFKISPDAPTVLIVMGMAGSGKTTFVHVS